jgi:photosystem II stability/assembly factor-like uncharacterized protein
MIVADVEERLRAHLARVVKTSAPVGWEARVSSRISRVDGPHRQAWLTQVGAVAALIAVAAGVFIGLRATRQNGPITPYPLNGATPTPSPTASATPAAAPFFNTIHMFTRQTGWAWTDRGVLRTTDGWAHWVNVGPPGASGLVGDVQFFTDASAWVVAGNAAYAPQTSNIFHTTDGGANWTRFSLNESSGVGPGQIDFVDATHGWLFVSYGAAAGSSGGAIYRTVDAGAHWIKVEQTVGGIQEAPGSLPFGCDKAGVSFVNTTTGWASGSCAGGGPFFFVTHDAGRTWSPQSFPIPAGFSGDGGVTTSLPVFFSDRSGYFILGGNQTVAYTTTNGGTSWVQHRLPAGGWSQPVGAISFSSLTDGWMISGDGTLIYRTNDGGQHWTSFRPAPLLTGPQGLDPIDATHAIAVLNPSGSQNFLTVTGDGGRTWRQIEP